MTVTSNESSASCSYPAATYDAQLRIRHEAEEMSSAQRDLTIWMDQIKSGQGKHNAEHKAEEVTFKKINHSVTEIVRIPNSSASWEEERLRGNQYFLQGDYEASIKCYSHCLCSKEAMQSPLVYSNRAMAYIKVKNWIQAELDATHALNIDPNHYKSYQRRCVARLSLGKLRAAMMDALSAEESFLLLGQCTTSDCMPQELKTKMDEILDLQKKVEHALSEAVKRAPRRKIRVEVVR